MQTKIIYSKRVMLALAQKDIQPITSMQNQKDLRYTCWIYELNDELIAALDEIMGGNSNGR